MNNAVQPQTIRPSARLLVLYACFFISGVAGLVYEVVWARYLALFIGSTGLAHVLVLATFMGGLALGSHVWGRLADRVASPLKLYVYLELGIGLFAVLGFEPMLDAGRWVFLEVARASGGVDSPMLAGGKVAACVLAVLIPTFLMGGTMPALSRHLVGSLRVLGPRISYLYFLNSLGAVCGCLVAGFYLIQAFGLEATLFIGAALNIVSGVGALLTSHETEEEVEESGLEAGATAQEGPVLSRGALWVVLVCVSLSGAVSMVYEVVWIRLLTLVLGSSTYSFSLMLATFIFGLSLGGLFLSVRRKTTGYGLIFGLCEMAVGLTILLSIPLYMRLPYWFNQLASSFSREPETFGLYQVSKFAMCAAVMLIPTILQGVTFPAAAKVVSSNLDRLGGRIGLVLAINTLGTLAGAVYAGLVGLPVFGIRHTLEMAIALNGVLGVAVLLATMPPSRRRQWVVAGGAVVSVAIWGLYVFSMRNWDPEILTKGLYRSRNRISSYESYRRTAAQRETIFHRDGIDATVTVEEMPSGDRTERMLVINGKTDASLHGDLLTQKMLGHVPMLLHRDPKDVLVIGLGSGATLAATLAYDSERVDFVEISQDVIDASRYFEEVNGAYWEDPRVHGHREDAKTFLQVSERKFDVIVSEPTNPWIAGVAGLFSREFFEVCRDHMAEGGLVMQWLQAYEMEDQVFLTILTTFSEVFPCYTVWNGCDSDTLLVGSVSPYGPDFERLERMLSDPRVLADLQNVEGFETGSVLPFLGTQMYNSAERNRFVEWTTARHSDAFPLLDYVAPRGFFVGARPRSLEWLDERLNSPANSDIWLPRYLKTHELQPEEFDAAYRFSVRNPTVFVPMARLWSAEWHRRFPEDKHALARLVRARGATHGEAVADLMEAREQEDLSFEASLALCEFLFADYEAARNSLSTEGAHRALNEITRLVENWGPVAATREIRSRQGEILYDLGRYEEAVAVLGPLLEDLDNRLAQRDLVERTGRLLCESFLALGRSESALSAWENIPELARLDLRLEMLKARIDMVAEAGAAGTR